MNALSPAAAQFVGAVHNEQSQVMGRHADADLIAACNEFRASEAAYCAIYDDHANISDDDALALSEPIVAKWDGLLDRMAAFRATTSEGLAARALVLAQHSGIKPGTEDYPFEFQPSDDTVTGRLLHMLLTDAVQMCSPPPPNPDAEMIATCAAFCELERAYDKPGYAYAFESPEEVAADAERARIVAQQEPLIDLMCDLPCSTVAGIQAMAMALATWDRELLKDGPAEDVGEVITSQLVERILALPTLEAVR